MFKFKIFHMGFSFLFINCSYATVFVLPSTGNTVGDIQYANPEVGETLAEVGRRYGIGFNEMLLANPTVEPNQPLPANAKLIIPSKFTIPQQYRSGIVISLDDYRLFYFPPNDNVVFTYPVGIGRDGWNTPTGYTKVVAKQAHPDWYPTAKIRTEAAKNGYPIPKYFPAGPNNPLGSHVLRLGWPTILIHGNNRGDGMGTRVSAGCIRMLAEDIEELFDMVPVGTPVRIMSRRDNS